MTYEPQFSEFFLIHCDLKLSLDTGKKFELIIMAESSTHSRSVLEKLPFDLAVQFQFSENFLIADARSQECIKKGDGLVLKFSETSDYYKFQDTYMDWLKKTAKEIIAKF